MSSADVCFSVSNTDSWDQLNIVTRSAAGIDVMVKLTCENVDFFFFFLLRKEREFHKLRFSISSGRDN